MIKKVYISLFAFCLLTTAKGQYAKEESADVSGDDFLRESYIGLNLGFSNPTGDFGSDSRSNEDASFAKMGYNVGITFNRLMSENIGFTFMLGRSAHKMNDKKFESILQDAFPYSNNPPYDQLTWSVSAGSYSTNSVLGGLLIAFPMDNGFFDLRLLMGYASSTLPSVTISATDGNIFEEQVQKSSTKGALALNIGAGFRLNLNEYLSLALNVDWYTTEPTFDQVVESNFGFSANDSYSMRMTMLNPTIGIGYRFY